MIKIILTGGGTGGHVAPLFPVAREIQKKAQAQNLQAEFYYLGPDNFLKQFLSDAGVEIKPAVLISGKFRRYFSLANFVDFFKIIFGIIQSLFQMWRIMPDAVFSKGGYGSIGPVIAAWFYRIPILIHESDTVPGAANRFLSHFTKFIALSFNEAAQFFPEGKTYYTGNPTRGGFFDLPQDSERQLLDLKSSKSLIFIEGSSQGAEKINDLVLLVLPDLLNFSEVIHQTGINNFDSVVGESKVILTEPNKAALYHPLAFLNEAQMTAAFHQAQLIVGRASAGTIFETAAASKPSILIPLDTAAADHQRKNAYTFAASGRAEVMEETNLTPQLFLGRVRSFIDNRQKALTMGKLARSFATPDAAGIIAEAIINLAS